MFFPQLFKGGRKIVPDNHHVFFKIAIRTLREMIGRKMVDDPSKRHLRRNPKSAVFCIDFPGGLQKLPVSSVFFRESRVVGDVFWFFGIF